MHNRARTIGTATAIAPGLALTALHVVATERSLRVGPGLAVREATTLPVDRFGPARGPARRSACGRWSITQGPVTGTDEADFATQLLLGPGASGAPVLDQKLRIAGVVTLDHESATICIGPLLLTTFLYQLTAGRCQGSQVGSGPMYPGLEDSSMPT